MLKKDTQFRVFLLRVLMAQKENMVNTLWMQVAPTGAQQEKMTSQYQENSIFNMFMFTCLNKFNVRFKW